MVDALGPIGLWQLMLGPFSRRKNSEDIQEAQLVLEAEEYRTREWQNLLLNEQPKVLGLGEGANTSRGNALRLLSRSRNLTSDAGHLLLDCQHSRNPLAWTLKRRRVFRLLRVCKQLNDSVDSLCQQRLIAAMDGFSQQNEAARRAGREHLVKLHQQLGAITLALDQHAEIETTPGRKGIRIQGNRKRNAPMTSESTSNIMEETGDQHGRESSRAVGEAPQAADQGIASLVEQMYKLALRGLFIIRKLLGASEDVAQLYARLKAWGIGLFGGSLGLTNILDKYPAYSNTPENDAQVEVGAFHLSLIDILLSIEQALILLDSNNSAVRDYQNELAGFLEADTPLKRTMADRTLYHAVTGDDRPDQNLALCLHKIEKEVGNLFMMLPVVESLRDIHQHRLPTQTSDDYSSEALEDIRPHRQGMESVAYEAEALKSSFVSPIENIWKHGQMLASPHEDNIKQRIGAFKRASLPEKGGGKRVLDEGSVDRAVFF